MNDLERRVAALERPQSSTALGTGGADPVVLPANVHLQARIDGTTVVSFRAEDDLLYELSPAPVVGGGTVDPADFGPDDFAGDDLTIPEGDGLLVNGSGLLVNGSPLEVVI